MRLIKTEPNRKRYFDHLGNRDASMRAPFAASLLGGLRFHARRFPRRKRINAGGRPWLNARGAADHSLRRRLEKCVWMAQFERAYFIEMTSKFFRNLELDTAQILFELRRFRGADDR